MCRYVVDRWLWNDDNNTAAGQTARIIAAPQSIELIVWLIRLLYFASFIQIFVSLKKTSKARQLSEVLYLSTKYCVLTVSQRASNFNQ